MESPSVEVNSEAEHSCPSGPTLPGVPSRSPSSEAGDDPAGAGPSSGPETERQTARPAVPPRSRVKAAGVKDAAPAEGRPVPAPRRSLAPTPAPRTVGLRTTEDKSCGPSPPSSLCTSTNSKVRPRHPWLSIIYPAPWTQPPPTPTTPPPHFWTLPPSELPFYRHKRHPRSSQVMKTRIDEDAEVHASSFRRDGELESPLPRGESSPGPEPHLPRSLSVPTLSSACSQTPVPSNRFSTSSQTEVGNQTSHISSRRSSAPGHGFPLMKRKVRPALDGSTDVLQEERASLDRQLRSLEQRGAELEGRLRTCGTDGEVEQMMVDWLGLVQERNVLVRRDLELAQLSEQLRLEERQADVEYELRRLLNKPESKWTDEERAGEQELMNTLVSVVEERNKIITVLEQDRQREREEDRLWLSMMENRELQKEGLEELRRSEGTFSPTKVLELLSHREESNGAQLAL